MPAYTNAKQHLPPQFQRKIEVDRQVKSLYDEIFRDGNVLHVSRLWLARYREAKNQQDLARYSCQESIKRANGPVA